MSAPPATGDDERFVTVAEVVHARAERIGLTLVAGANGLSRELPLAAPHESDTDAVGYLDVNRPVAIQIVDPKIHAALSAKDSTLPRDVRRLFERRELAVVVVGDELPIPGWLVDSGNQTGVCIYRSSLSHSMLYERLQHRAARKMIAKTTLHGVLMSIKNVGVLITGPSGIGKSEVALELVNRGHRLVADDVVQVYRSSSYKISGFCPELIRGYLEIRGLGVLDIADIFGNTAILDSLPIDIVLRLERDGAGADAEFDRLRPRIRHRSILETNVPEITLLVAPGRNLAILIEAAVRTHIQYQFGKDPVKAFIDKQRKLIENRDRLHRLLEQRRHR